MNIDKFGRYSIIMGGVTFFYLIMYLLDDSMKVLPDIIIGIMSLAAILFGIITFIKRGQEKNKAAMGILLGLLCLIPTSTDLFFPEKALHFEPGYKEVKFLGNSSIVGFRYCSSYNNCSIKYTYDVTTQKFIKQEEGNELDKYSFSRDGKKALFTDGPENGKNIFIMNADGTGKRQLTHSSDKDTIIVRDDFGDMSMKVKANSFPSFSPDGKRVIFVRHTFMVKKRSGVSYLRDCDIYEVYVETGNERKLTNYNFYNVTCPKYFSDGNRFIFSADGLKIDDYKAYNAQYKNNVIFIMDANNTELKPAISHSEYCKYPSISFNDEIVYVANMDIRDKPREVFIRIDDKTKSLTNMKTDIISPEISSNGKWIVFKEQRRFDKKPYIENHFWLMNSDGTGLTELIPPKV